MVSWKLSAPIVDAVTDSAGLSEWEKAELTVSDRPDLASAKVVISGGMNYLHLTFTVAITIVWLFKDGDLFFFKTNYIVKIWAWLGLNLTETIQIFHLALVVKYIYMFLS